MRLTEHEHNEIKKKATWLRRVCQPFHEFENIISVGLESQVATQHLIEPNTREYITDLSGPVRSLRVEDANVINSHLPLIAARLAAPTTTAWKVRVIAREIQHVANGAKDWDTKHMKADVLSLIPEKYLPDTDANGTVVRKVAASYINMNHPEQFKSWRGFNHLVTARLLCPAKYIEQFKWDPGRTVQDLKHRHLRLIDGEGYPFFPVFLYDEDMMDGSATKGLFHGPLLVKAHRYLFLGPSRSDAASTKKSKQGNAAIHGMQTVKPSTICYAVIQVYVALSNMTAWAMTDEEVDLSMLYDLLRQQLSNLSDPWVKETLQWWDSQVFPSPTDTSNSRQDLRDMEGPTMRELLGADYAARMSREGHT